jgi:carboxylesterase type B
VQDTVKLKLAKTDGEQELHQALDFNETSQVYTFQNIRYAQAPVGNLRFRAPAPPQINRTLVQNGSEARTCPQGVPVWQLEAFGPIAEFSDPRSAFNLSVWENSFINASAPNIPFNADVTEDCLFLDVHVPKTVLDEATSSKKGYRDSESCQGAPVLVWVCCHVSI